MNSEKESLFDRAVIFAVQAHSGQKRKDGGPYVTHVLETAVIISGMTHDETMLAAGVLHDTVEDAGVKPEELARLFGERTAFLVASETEDKRRGIPASETWEIRKEESLQFLKNCQDKDVEMLWLGDKLSNIRSLYHSWVIMGDDVWKMFHQQDPDRQYWYYSTIRDILEKDLGTWPAWKEYAELIRVIFNRKEKKGE